MAFAISDNPRRKVAKPSKLSAYKCIEADLRMRIASKEWRSGDLLPGRRALAQHYQVTLPTLEAAIGALIDDGTLRTEVGRGTFVDVVEQASIHGAGSLRGSVDEPRPTSLGILYYEPFASAWAIPRTIDSWLYQISVCLERSFFVDGGVTRSASINSGAGAEDRPVSEPLLEMSAQGIRDIVVVDPCGVMPTDTIDEIVRWRDAHDIRVVYLGPVFVDSDIPQVVYDSPYLAGLAAKHLMNLGIRSMAYVSPYRLPWSVARFEQARLAASQAGLGDGAVTPIFGDCEEAPIGDGTSSRQYHLALAFGRRLLEANGFPRCIIAANDYAAHGLIDAASEYRFKAGTDYAIVGFDDEARSIHYGLTTFQPPLEEIAREATAMLARLVRNESCGMNIRVRSRLIKRASTLHYKPDRNEPIGGTI